MGGIGVATLTALQIHACNSPGSSAIMGTRGPATMSPALPKPPVCDPAMPNSAMPGPSLHPILA
eukprot:862576-Pelagomonas_calceolata.AAC.4